MERLTERDEYGNSDIIALSDIMPEIYAELSFSETNALTEAINRLATYEDTGMEPEEVTAIKNAIMGRKIAKITEFDGIPIRRLQELARAEKDGRLVMLPPNDPLTLEELREMDGEPVWVVIASGGRYAVIRFCGEIFTEFTDGMQLPNGRYETYWLAYRRKPEEGIL